MIAFLGGNQFHGLLPVPTLCGLNLETSNVSYLTAHPTALAPILMKWHRIWRQFVDKGAGFRVCWTRQDTGWFPDISLRDEGFIESERGPLGHSWRVSDRSAAGPNALGYRFYLYKPLNLSEEMPGNELRIYKHD